MSPVSEAFTRTVAPATTAPLASVTIPEIPASTLAYNGTVRAITYITNTINPRQTCLANPPQISVSTSARIPHCSRRLAFMAPPLPNCLYIQQIVKTFIRCAYINEASAASRRNFLQPIQACCPAPLLCAQIHDYCYTHVKTALPGCLDLEAVEHWCRIDKKDRLCH